MDFSYKVIRDPIHGYIGLTENETNILDTLAMQRLRKIKQLANAHLVYPSTMHSRFEHSLGVLFIANRMAKKLTFDEEDLIRVRTAALLHDVGHGPFSHVFEIIIKNVTGDEYDHEDMTCNIIRNDQEIQKNIKDVDQIIDILSNKKRQAVDRDIITSQLDADKLDYLIRDSYHAGVMYGVFDIERIIHTIHEFKNQRGSYIGVLEKGMDALENYRLGYYLMHRQVYQHHVRAITDAMMLKGIILALAEGALDANDFVFEIDNQGALNRFYSLDDYSFTHNIKKKSNGTGGKMIQALETRNLFKRAYEEDLENLSPISRLSLSEMNIDTTTELESIIAEKAKVKQENVIAYVRNIKNPLFKTPLKGIENRPILILCNNGEIRSLDDMSPITGTQNISSRIYVFSRKEDSNTIGSIAAEVISDF